MFSGAEYGLWDLVILNSLMFPILVLVYIRLAHSEEKEALNMFGEHYVRYMHNTPRLIPRIRWQAASQRLG